VFFQKVISQWSFPPKTTKKLHIYLINVNIKGNCHAFESVLRHYAHAISSPELLKAGDVDSQDSTRTGDNELVPSRRNQ
jgi:hypothetical protein